jgi:hypothetical protein
MLNTGVVGAGIKDFCWKQTRPYVERDERLEILMIYCTVQINTKTKTKTKTIQYSTVQYSTVQYSTVQYSTVYVHVHVHVHVQSIF